MNLKKKLERYLRVNLFGPGPSSYKKNIYRAAVSQRLGNTGKDLATPYVFTSIVPNLGTTMWQLMKRMKSMSSWIGYFVAADYLETAQSDRLRLIAQRPRYVCSYFHSIFI
jgi:hypothetical protein